MSALAAALEARPRVACAAGVASMPRKCALWQRVLACLHDGEGSLTKEVIDLANAALPAAAEMLPKALLSAERSTADGDTDSGVVAALRELCNTVRLAEPMRAAGHTERAGKAAPALAALAQTGAALACIMPALAAQGHDTLAAEAAAVLRACMRSLAASAAAAGAALRCPGAVTMLCGVAAVHSTWRAYSSTYEQRHVQNVDAALFAAVCSSTAQHVRDQPRSISSVHADVLAMSDAARTVGDACEQLASAGIAAPVTLKRTQPCAANSTAGAAASARAHAMPATGGPLSHCKLAALHGLAAGVLLGSTSMLEGLQRDAITVAPQLNVGGTLAAAYPAVTSARRAAFAVLAARVRGVTRGGAPLTHLERGALAQAAAVAGRLCATEACCLVVEHGDDNADIECSAKMGELMQVRSGSCLVFLHACKVSVRRL